MIVGIASMGEGPVAKRSCHRLAQSGICKRRRCVSHPARLVHPGSMAFVRLAAGREVREHMFTQVAELFHDLDAGMLPVSVLFPYLSIPPHRRRDRCAQLLFLSCYKQWS